MQNELPRIFLGVSVKNPRKNQVLEYLIAAVAGSNATEVHTVLSDIASRFSDQPFARAADTALQKMGQTVARKKAPEQNDSVTLSGDLALFGLQEPRKTPHPNEGPTNVVLKDDEGKDNECS